MWVVKKKKKLLVYFELLSLQFLEEAKGHVKWTVTSSIYIYIYIYMSELLQHHIPTNFTDCSKCTLTTTDLLLCWKKNVHKGIGRKF